MVTIEKKKGRQTIIRICDPGYHDGFAHSGIQIEINKKDKSFYISGWYDQIAGIQGDTIKLDEFLELFK